MTVRGTVIIVTYNAGSYIKRCLNSLYDSASRGAIKVLVVDNCSNDDTTEIVQQEFPWVELLNSAYNGGFGFGNNTGLLKAEGEWVFFLNPDAAITTGCLEVLENYLRSNPETGCVAPAIADENGKRILSYFPFTNLWISIWWAVGLYHLFPFNRTNQKREIRREPPNETVVVDRVLGAAMMLLRKALAEVGGFDERFFLFSEEEDLCFRLNKAGWINVYNPDATVIHTGSGIVDSIKPIAIAAANWSRYVYLKKNTGRISAEISRWIWIKMILLRYIGSFFWFSGNRKRDYQAGYIYSIKSLLKPGFFEEFLRPPVKKV